MDVGRLVAGRYRLRGRVGAGAMGVVWQALDERLDRVVALKQLVVPEGSDPVEAVGRAAREGRIAARLRHPNAVTLHDVVEDDGKPVLVMEYLPSRTLAELLAEHGPLPDEQVVRIGAQVAGALAAAHAVGVVHRDVKPGNVLVTDDGTAKITDFGIARAVGDVTVTRTGLLPGTPAYLSPEVARGGEPGPASDVFALGSTLYAAVEGRPPFGDGDNTIALLHAVAAGRFAPPAQAGPLTDVLMDALRTDPAARPTMAQLADRLRSPNTAPPAATRLDLHPISEHPTGGDTADVHTTGPHPTGLHTAGPHAPAPHAPDPHAPGPRAPGPRTSGPQPTGLLPRPKPKGRGRLIVLTAAAVIGLVVLGVVVATRDKTPDNAAPGVPSTATPTSATGPTPAQLEQVVADYYALLPGNTAQAWERLGPGLRAQGRRQYEQAWRDVKDLTVSSAPQATGPDAVTVGIDYTGAGGGRVRESHRLGLVTRDGTTLIDSDEVLAAQRLDGKGNDEDDDKGKEDEKEEKKKEDKERGGGRNGNG